MTIKKAFATRGMLIFMILISVKDFSQINSILFPLGVAFLGISFMLDFYHLLDYDRENFWRKIFISFIGHFVLYALFFMYLKLKNLI
ncbi:MAG: hypothetical protein R3Y57_07185 [Erysipelotrichaceae bacterium]